MPESTEANGAQEEVHDRMIGGVVLPEEPGIEELARDWTLSETDIGEVLLCRGTDNCLRLASQLSVLRRFGRFLEEYDDPPVRIVNLLAPARPAAETHLLSYQLKRTWAER